MDSLSNIIEALNKGSFVVVHDEHREKEADFFLLAEHVTSEKINFLLTHAKGMICIASDDSLLKKMGLSLLSETTDCPHGTGYCMSFDAKNGVTTGISASDKARAIQVFIDSQATAADITTPGHSFPLLAQNPENRFGHTDCGVLLAKKCEAIPAMIICEILNEAGEIASFDEVKYLAKKFNVSVTTLETLRTELLG